MTLFNTLIFLKSHTGKNLQNDFWRRNARCKNANTDIWEKMMLQTTSDGKTVIKSLKDNRNLQVQPSGQCVFANYNQELWGKFDIEVVDGDKLIFVSCHTGKFLQCNEEGLVFTGYQNNEAWKFWTIIYPETTGNEKPLISFRHFMEIIASSSVSHIVTLAFCGALTGAASSIIIGSLLCFVLAPYAMTASCAAGGVAALLQQYGIFFLSIKGIGISSFLGAIAPCIHYVMSTLPLDASAIKGELVDHLPEFENFLQFLKKFSRSLIVKILSDIARSSFLKGGKQSDNLIIFLKNALDCALRELGYK